MVVASTILDKCRRFVEAQHAIDNGYYPFFQAIRECDGTTAWMAGRRVIMAGSSNYLGLTHHPHVIERTREAVAKYGSSVTGSRLLSGTLDLHEELEERLARFLGREAVLVFPTGYQAQLGAIAALAGKNDEIFGDRHNHASVLDGCRLSFAALRKYRHASVADLDRLLEQSDPAKGKLIVTDGVFSMDGDLAPLPDIVRCSRKYDAAVMVDDAHGVGVIGQSGRGTLEVLGTEDDIDILTGSLSKSLGSIGGFVAADHHVIHYVKHHARSFIFTGSLPASAIAAALAALDVVEQEPQRRVRLSSTTAGVAQRLADLGFRMGSTEAPMIPVLLGDRIKTLKFFQAMVREGVYVNPVIAPAVPSGSDRLRLCLMATHTDEHLAAIVGAFAKVGRAFEEI